MINKKYIALFILISIISFFLNYYIFFNYHNNNWTIISTLTTKNNIFLEDYISSIIQWKTNDTPEIIKRKIETLNINDYKKTKNFLRLLVASKNQNSDLIISTLDKRTDFWIKYENNSLESYINEKILKNVKIKKWELENKKIANLWNLYLIIREAIKTNKIDLIIEWLDDIIEYKDSIVQQNSEFDSLKYALESIKYEKSHSLIDENIRIKRFIKHFYLVFLSDIDGFSKDCSSDNCKSRISELKKQWEIWFNKVWDFDKNKIDNYINEWNRILSEKKYNNLYPVLNIWFIMSAIYRYNWEYENAIKLLDSIEDCNLINEKWGKINLWYFYFYFHKWITLFEKWDREKWLELINKQRQYYILYSYLEMYEKSLILINKWIKDSTILWWNYNLNQNGWAN